MSNSESDFDLLTVATESNLAKTFFTNTLNEVNNLITQINNLKLEVNSLKNNMSNNDNSLNLLTNKFINLTNLLVLADISDVTDTSMNYNNL